MVFPIGHDHGELRRWPILSFAILAICVLLQLLPSGVSSEKLREANDAFVESFEYYLEHLELTPHPLLRSVAMRYSLWLPSDERRELRDKIDNPPPGTPMTELRQDSLDKKTNIWVKVLQRERTWQWGYIPGQSDWVRLITHMFLHGGFMHLFFNMLFLYVMAPFIEDQWGRPLFLLFYLTAGVFAALMFAWHKPDAGVPLVGASGAIAGVMGAFLVRFPKASIKFWRLFPPGTFHSPAWLVLPMWFAGELLQARVDSTGMPNGGETVAYWAHVYGFGFGVAVGLLMWALSVEEKYVKPAIEAQIFGSDPALSDINRLLTQGRSAEAADALERVLATSPSNLDAAFAYWSIAADMGRMAERSSICQRVIGTALRGEQDAEALELWESFNSQVPDANLDVALALPLSRCLERSGKRPQAVDVLTRARASVGIDTNPETLVEYGRRVRELDAPVADEVAEFIQRNPRVPRADKQAFAPTPSFGEGMAGARLAAR